MYVYINMHVLNFTRNLKRRERERENLTGKMRDVGNLKHTHFETTNLSQNPEAGAASSDHIYLYLVYEIELGVPVFFFFYYYLFLSGYRGDEIRSWSECERKRKVFNV